MTTNPRFRAGKPAAYLHRVDTSQLERDDGVTVLPIQFAGDEPNDEDGPPEMLALALVLTFVCIVLGAFAAGVMS